MVTQKNGTSIADSATAPADSTNSGNNAVKVAVRVRPFSEDERRGQAHACLRIDNNQDHKASNCGGATGESQNLAYVTVRDKAFAFDTAFGSDSSQTEIFDRVVRALIDGCLDGYNATLLAYGQTGSGKTYTMGTCPLDQQLSEQWRKEDFKFEFKQESESECDTSRVGVLPRAMSYLFERIERSRAEAVNAGRSPPEFRVSVQFVELYNEELIDLLDSISRPPPSRPSSASSSSSSNKISIHEDARGSIFLTGVSSRLVGSVSETMRCLTDGATQRVTAETLMNKTSSRSHAIFTVHIRQQRMLLPLSASSAIPTTAVSTSTSTETNVISSTAADLETLTAKFHFVDLAGSERLKRTGAVGDRAKEGISINGGLLALGNVISALSDRARGKVSRHVPYRDSKLTRLLQDSLGGNSRTWMVACVSPSDRDFVETLNTLNYASRAREIRNRVTVNQDKSSVLIAELRKTVHRLESQLLTFAASCRCACRSIIFGDAPVTAIANNSSSSQPISDENRPILGNHNAPEVEGLRAECERHKAEATALARANAELVERNKQLAEQLVTTETRHQHESDSSSDGKSTSHTNVSINVSVNTVTDGHANHDAQLERLLIQYAEQREELHARVIELEAMRLVGLEFRPDVDIGSRWTTRPEPSFTDAEADADADVDTDLDAETVQEVVFKTDLSGKRRSISTPCSVDLLANIDPSMKIGEKRNKIDASLSDEGVDRNRKEEMDATNDVNGDGDGDADATMSTVTREIARVDSQIAARERLLRQLMAKTAELTRLRDAYERQIGELQRAINDTCVERDRALADLERIRAEPQASEKAKNDAKANADALQETYRQKLEQLEARQSALVEASAKNGRLMRENAEKERQLKRLLSDLESTRRSKVTLVRQLEAERNKARLASEAAKRSVEQLEKRNATLGGQLRSLQRVVEQKDALLRRKIGELDAARKQRRAVPVRALHSALDPLKSSNEVTNRSSRPTSSNNVKADIVNKERLERMEQLLMTLAEHRKRQQRVEQELSTWILEREQLAGRLDLAQQLLTDKRAQQSQSSSDSDASLSELETELRSIRAQIDDVQERIDDCESQLLDDAVDSVQLNSTASAATNELQRLLDSCSVPEMRAALDLAMSHFCKLNEVNNQSRVSHNLNGTGIDHGRHSKAPLSMADAELAFRLLKDALSFVERANEVERDKPTDVNSSPRHFSRNQGEVNVWRQNVRNLLQVKVNTVQSSPSLSASSTSDTFLSSSDTPIASRSASSVQAPRLDVLVEATRSSARARFTEPVKRRSKSSSVVARRCSQPSLVQSAAGARRKSRPATVTVTISNTAVISSPPTPAECSPPDSPTACSKRSAIVTDDDAEPVKTPKNVTPTRSSSVAIGRRPRLTTRAVARLASLDCMSELVGHRHPVLDCWYSEDSQVLFTSGFDGVVKCWDVSQGVERESIVAGAASYDKVTHVRYSPELRALFCATADSVRLYDLRESSKYVKAYFTNGSVAQSGGFFAADSRRHETFVRGLALAGTFLFAASGATVRVWDTRIDQLFPKLFCAQKVMTIHVDTSPSQTRVADDYGSRVSTGGEQQSSEGLQESRVGGIRVIAGCKDHNVRVFDTSTSSLQNSTCALLPTVTLSPPHCDGVEALVTSRDGRTLFSATRDACIRKWDVRDLTQSRVVDQRSNAHTDWIRGLALIEPQTDEDGRGACLLSCSKDGTVQLWNTGAADHHKITALRTVRAHNDSVNAIRTNRAGLAFTASSDCTARIWRVRTAEM